MGRIKEKQHEIKGKIFCLHIVFGAAMWSAFDRYSWVGFDALIWSPWVWVSPTLSLSLSLSQFTDFPLTCALGFFHVLPNWNLLSGGGGVVPGEWLVWVDRTHLPIHINIDSLWSWFTSFLAFSFIFYFLFFYYFIFFLWELPCYLIALFLLDYIFILILFYCLIFLNLFKSYLIDLLFFHILAINLSFINLW